jgi:hypothetical protein
MRCDLPREGRRITDLLIRGTVSYSGLLVNIGSMGFTDTLKETKADTELSGEDRDRFSHYVEKDQVAEAYIMGTPVIALCGKIWVPSRDPEKFPVCPQCKEIFNSLFLSE